ncbi:ABC transporter ATP-binding protein [Paenibacillus hemerocallicola]|uniref:ABC transporter ATP-binding protein n=1 Tax=Paenibacillus hemerocallicola TaxID=1172614 RepID=A0A5C4TCL8_9BACL|nr:ABC transporter ATP-binding protein [Paenibacillus hemerocallicola]TNJ66290.1 ABC transporter ATP-binding protein [Paenibacillus hemerocallicola]
MKTIRWIWVYVSKARWAIGLSMLVLVLGQSAQIMAQGSQKFLIDDVLVGKHYDKLKWVLLYFTLTYLTSYVLNWWGRYLTRMNGLCLHKHMGSSLMSVIQRTPVSSIQSGRTAKWVQYFTSDIQQVSTFVTDELPRGIQQLGGTLLLIAIIGWNSPVVLGIVTVFSVLYIAIGRYFAPIMRKQVREMQEKRGELLTKIEEGISSTREVIAFNRMAWEEKSFRGTFAIFFDRVMQNGKLANSQLLLSNSVQWIGRMAVLVFGGYSVIKGNVSIGAFVIVYQYSNQLFTNYQTVFNFAMNMSGQLAYSDRVKELFEQEKIGEGTRELRAPVKSIEFESVTFAYPGTERHVLNDLDLSLPTGRKLAIVGASGGGKSTITQLLLRFFEPSSGCIRINGIPLSDIRMTDWMGKLSVVFQEPFLLPDTIRNNLMLGRVGITDEQMIDACRSAQIHDFIESLEQGYDTVVGERGYTLSGGQRQRVAIARAMMGDPELMIMDEATSALDMETEQKLQENLDKRRAGKTTIVIAHRLSTIRNADLILVMHQGRLVEQGTHEELMAKDEAYRRLVSTMSENGAGSIGA